MGARADGVTKDTVAIQKAIDTCASKGGGTVVLQGGTFLSGPLDLRSHVDLSVAKGTLLKASEEVDDFPVREDARWRRMALIHADQAEDIAITGEGTIDGSGQGWWTRHLNRPKGSPEPPRPMIVDITRSKKIRIEGVTIQNAPMYNILTNLCDGLTVRNVRILNPGRKAPNTDGIDPLSTSHVLIEHAYIDTGDDNVAIKSGLVERGEPIVPSRDITIRDCEFVHGHGLSIGSELAGGVQHVRVERVSFKGSDQGIRIKSARGRGNDFGDFHYKDITMEDVRTAIQITGRHNYGRFSQWAYDKGLVPTPSYFVENPTELSDWKWAFVGAAWYWTVERPDINSLCDRGDVVNVTYRINGGQNGIDDRTRRWNLALAQGNALLELLTPQEEGPLMALTAAEQTELLTKVRYIFDQLGPKDPSWPTDSSLGKDAAGKELTMRDGLAELKRTVEAAHAGTHYTVFPELVGTLTISPKANA